MNFERLSEGIVLLCDLQGIVLRVLHSSADVVLDDGAGLPLTRLLDRRSLSKGLSFLVELRTQGAAFGWELGVQSEDHIEVLHFAGVVSEESILVIGAKDQNQVSNLYETLVKINNEQMNALRTAVKEREELSRSAQQDGAIYEDFSRLNNELVNLQRQLARKNAELERLDEIKNHFIGMAAHDLRNPLAAIQAYSEFVLEDLEGAGWEEQVEFLQIIHSSSQFMLQMVNDLLDVSTIESGELQLNLGPTDIVRLVRQNVELNSTLARRKRITLSFEHHGDFPEMWVDGPKIEQVLNNLISNAVKYSYPETEVTIRLERIDGAALISVDDEGQGIPENELQNLFTYFGRTSVRGTAGERSTGLGLAIARNIVEGHKGDIWVESEVGQGSTFYVSLPLDMQDLS
jgi:signal transduction histidine kinase